MKKPKIFSDLGLSNDFGLSNYLAWYSAISEIAQKSSFDKLNTIRDGVVPPNLIELIQSEGFVELMQELTRTYDYFILNTALVVLVANALKVTYFLPRCWK